jgi:hypothetical protein
MKKIDLIITCIAAIALLISWAVPAVGVEPARPPADQTLGPDKETKIDDIRGLSIKETFEKLKDADFLNDDELLNRAVFRTFSHRKLEAIDFATNYLKAPVIEIIDGQVVSRGDDFSLAKKIFEVFPEESTRSLLDLYKLSDAITKGNIIRASGMIADNSKAIRNLLIKALDDKIFCDEEDPETLGEPLRICDVAYNQLVLRYKVRNVLRTIGPVFSIQVRDYHIGILNDVL